MSAPPAAVRALTQEVDAALAGALDRLLPRVEGYHPELGPVADALGSFVAGGKRLRPVMLLLGYEAAGGGDRRRVHGPALALELLHTSALMHDDVIDQAPTRRGRPSVHARFAQVHREADWGGDADAYGQAIAILVGDLAFVHADELFMDAEVDQAPLLAAFRRFTVLREEVMVGQYLDLRAATTRTTDRDLALAVATLKAGRYSVTRPLEIGAMLAGADPALVEGLHGFGEPLGRAFQVQDDLLGVFGDPDTTGKSTSSDLAEGKRTLLIAEAATRLEGADADLLETTLGDPGIAASDVDRVRVLLEACGARRAAATFVADEIATARAALASLDLADGVAATLDELARYLGARST